MDTQKLVIDRAEARALYRKYREHQHYSKPIDHQIMLAYQRLAQGRLVIKALASIIAAGVNQDGLPKLAIARATADKCWLTSGKTPDTVQISSREIRQFRSRGRERAGTTFAFPFVKPPGRWRYQAMVPLIPVHLRPKRGLANYHILWEAEWQRIAPVDPFLLRRIGETDMWVVVAMWDLSPVERAALEARL